MTDLLDLLEQDHPTPPTGIVHAIRPNMWAACGWCLCGCEGHRGDTFVLRTTHTHGVTCPTCLTVMGATA